MVAPALVAVGKAAFQILAPIIAEKGIEKISEKLKGEKAAPAGVAQTLRQDPNAPENNSPAGRFVNYVADPQNRDKIKTLSETVREAHRRGKEAGLSNKQMVAGVAVAVAGYGVHQAHKAGAFKKAWEGVKARVGSRKEAAPAPVAVAPAHPHVKPASVSL